MSAEIPDKTIERIDLNAASTDRLCEALPGIGPVLADRIVAFRAGHGPFASLTELARVPGIGPRLAAQLSKHICLQEEVKHPPVPSALPDVEPAASAEPAACVAPAPALVLDEVLADDDDVILVEVARPAPPVPPRKARPFAVVALLGLLTATTAGAWHSQRSARASSTMVDHEVRELRAQEDRNHDEIERLVGLLAAAEQGLAEARDVQKAAQARQEARSARIAADVAALAERTRQAQARLDARVYRLDEAMKLVDWVTTKGLAREVAAEPAPPDAAGANHAVVPTIRLEPGNR